VSGRQSAWEGGLTQVDREKVLVSLVARAQMRVVPVPIDGGEDLLHLCALRLPEEAPSHDLGHHSLDHPEWPSTTLLPLVPDERLVALVDLATVGLLRLAKAVTRVVTGERREDLEDPGALLERRERDLGSMHACPQTPEVWCSSSLPLLRHDGLRDRHTSTR
jgi:hypothetical protein